MRTYSSLKERFIGDNSKDSGFTLVEMVIAVVIFGLLTTLVFNLFSTSRETTANVQAGSTSIAEAQTATTQLDRKIRNAVNYKVTEGGSRLDVENSDGTCTTWVYNNGVLYYNNVGEFEDFSNSWFQRLPQATLSETGRFFTPVVGGVSYAFRSGDGVGTKLIEGTSYMRVQAEGSTSVCFGDAPAESVPTPSPSPTATPAPVYTITYDLAGGLATGNPNSYTANYASFTLNTPTREGYSFVGWTGTGITGSMSTVTINNGSTGNRAYAATWDPIAYPITYDLAGGTANGNGASYTVETATFTLNNPTRSGYSFAGWTGTGITGTSTSVSVPVGSTGNRSYTATWVGQPTPTPTPTPAAQFDTRWTKTNAWHNTVQGNFSYFNKSNTNVRSVIVTMKVPGATGVAGSNLSCSYLGSNEFRCQSPAWGTISNNSWSPDYYIQFTGSSLGSNGNPAVQILSITKNS